MPYFFVFGNRVPVAVIVVQTSDIWPYVMTDSTGDGANVSIPIVMVRPEHGKKLEDLLGKATSSSGTKASVGAAAAAGAGAAVMTGTEAGERLVTTGDFGSDQVFIRLRRESMENKCVICQDDFSRGSTITAMPCLHAFHRECLLTWLRMRNSCPTCRFQVRYLFCVMVDSV